MMRDAARRLLSVSWRRAPKGGETHSSPPAAVASRPSVTPRTASRVRSVPAALPAPSPFSPPVPTSPLSGSARPTSRRRRTSPTTVLDRRDRLLRAFTTPDGRWRLPVEAADVDQRYLAMLMAFEDKRFYDHGGVDLRSLARAAVQLVENRRIVSGASTLTMQVARLIEGHYERSGGAKLRQIVGALRLEHHLTKHADPVAVPAARAVRRQHRGRARRVAGLLRQGAAAAVGRRGCPAGRAAAVARMAPPGPQPARGAHRPRPRAAAGTGGRRHHRGRGRSRDARAGSHRPPRLPEAGAAPGRSRGGGRSKAADPSPHHRPHGAEGARGACRRADQTARARSCRRPSSPSITPPAR